MSLFWDSFFLDFLPPRCEPLRAESGSVGADAAPGIQQAPTSERRRADTGASPPAAHPPPASPSAPIKPPLPLWGLAGPLCPRDDSAPAAVAGPGGPERVPGGPASPVHETPRAAGRGRAGRLPHGETEAGRAPHAPGDQPHIRRFAPRFPRPEVTSPPHGDPRAGTDRRTMSEAGSALGLREEVGCGQKDTESGTLPACTQASVYPSQKAGRALGGLHLRLFSVLETPTTGPGGDGGHGAAAGAADVPPLLGACCMSRPVLDAGDAGSPRGTRTPLRSPRPAGRRREGTGPGTGRVAPRLPAYSRRLIHARRAT